MGWDKIPGRTAPLTRSQLDELRNLLQLRKRKGDQIGVTGGEITFERGTDTDAGNLRARLRANADTDTDAQGRPNLKPENGYLETGYDLVYRGDSYELDPQKSFGWASVKGGDPQQMNPLLSGYSRRIGRILRNNEPLEAAVAAYVRPLLPPPPPKPLRVLTQQGEIDTRLTQFVEKTYLFRLAGTGAPTALAFLPDGTATELPVTENQLEDQRYIQVSYRPEVTGAHRITIQDEYNAAVALATYDINVRSFIESPAEGQSFGLLPGEEFKQKVRLRNSAPGQYMVQFKKKEADTFVPFGSDQPHEVKGEAEEFEFTFKPDQMGQYAATVMDADGHELAHYKFIVVPPIKELQALLIEAQKSANPDEAIYLILNNYALAAEAGEQKILWDAFVEMIRFEAGPSKRKLDLTVTPNYEQRTITLDLGHPDAPMVKPPKKGGYKVADKDRLLDERTREFIGWLGGNLAPGRVSTPPEAIDIESYTNSIGPDKVNLAASQGRAEGTRNLLFSVYNDFSPDSHLPEAVFRKITGRGEEELKAPKGAWKSKPVSWKKSKDRKRTVITIDFPDNANVMVGMFTKPKPPGPPASAVLAVSDVTNLPTAPIQVEAGKDFAHEVQLKRPGTLTWTIRDKKDPAKIIRSIMETTASDKVSITTTALPEGEYIVELYDQKDTNAKPKDGTGAFATFEVHAMTAVPPPAALTVTNPPSAADLGGLELNQPTQYAFTLSRPATVYAIVRHVESNKVVAEGFNAADQANPTPADNVAVNLPTDTEGAHYKVQLYEGRFPSTAMVPVGEWIFGPVKKPTVPPPPPPPAPLPRVTNYSNGQVIQAKAGEKTHLEFDLDKPTKWTWTLLKKGSASATATYGITQRTANQKVTFEDTLTEGTYTLTLIDDSDGTNPRNFATFTIEVSKADVVPPPPPPPVPPTASTADTALLSATAALGEGLAAQTEFDPAIQKTRAEAARRALEAAKKELQAIPAADPKHGEIEAEIGNINIALMEMRTILDRKPVTPPPAYKAPVVTERPAKTVKLNEAGTLIFKLDRPTWVLLRMTRPDNSTYHYEGIQPRGIATVNGPFKIAGPYKVELVDLDAPAREGADPATQTAIPFEIFEFTVEAPKEEPKPPAPPPPAPTATVDSLLQKATKAKQDYFAIVMIEPNNTAKQREKLLEAKDAFAAVLKNDPNHKEAKAGVDEMNGMIKALDAKPAPTQPPAPPPTPPPAPAEPTTPAPPPPAKGAIRNVEVTGGKVFDGSKHLRAKFGETTRAFKAVDVIVNGKKICTVELPKGKNFERIIIPQEYINIFAGTWTGNIRLRTPDGEEIIVEPRVTIKGMSGPDTVEPPPSPARPRGGEPGIIVPARPDSGGGTPPAPATTGGTGGTQLTPEQQRLADLYGSGGLGDKTKPTTGRTSASDVPPNQAVATKAAQSEKSVERAFDTFLTEKAAAQKRAPLTDEFKGTIPRYLYAMIHVNKDGTVQGVDYFRRAKQGNDMVEGSAVILPPNFKKKMDDLIMRWRLPAQDDSYDIGTPFEMRQEIN